MKTQLSTIKKAISLGLNVISILGILLIAKQRRLITKYSAINI